MESALDDVDWKIVGEALRNLAPLLEKMGDSIEETGNLDMSDLGEIQRWNGPLVTATLKLMEHEVSGSGAPGVFTNPGVVSNMLFAALEGTDSPMSADQQSALHEATLAVLEEERQHGGDCEEKLGIENFIAEMERKQRYFDRVDEILSDSQRAVVHPETENGNTGVDLLSSGIAWRSQVIPVLASNPEELQHKFVEMHMKQLKRAEEARPVLERVAADWAASLGEELPKGRAGALIKQLAYYPLEHTRNSAHSYLPARKAMLAQLPLTDEQRKKLSIDAYFIVPFSRP